jgi:hypothetical protein
VKTLIVAATLAVAGVGLQTAAEAQRAPVYRYCLIEYLGPRGGGGTILCRFNTWAQCMASRSGPSDSCFVNPEYYTGRR